MIKIMPVKYLGSNQNACVQHGLSVIVKVRFLKEKQVIIVHGNILHLVWKDIEIHD